MTFISYSTHLGLFHFFITMLYYFAVCFMYVLSVFLVCFFYTREKNSCFHFTNTNVITSLWYGIWYMVYSIWYGMVRYGMVRYGMVRYGYGVRVPYVALSPT